MPSGPSTTSRRCTPTTSRSTSTSTAPTFAATWNAGWPGGPGAVLGFKVDRRDEVDSLVETLVAAGVPVQQPPCDAFWGARYAVVSDPDGNGVGIMSPIDPERRTAPPELP